jgi:hypothetical protein
MNNDLYQNAARALLSRPITYQVLDQEHLNRIAKIAYGSGPIEALFPKPAEMKNTNA